MVHKFGCCLSDAVLSPDAASPKMLPHVQRERMNIHPIPTCSSADNLTQNKNLQTSTERDQTRRNESKLHRFTSNSGEKINQQGLF